MIKMQKNRNLLWVGVIGLLLLTSMLACQSTVPDLAPASVEQPAQVIVVSTEQVDTSAPPILIDPTDQEDALVALYKRANPAVVNITVYTNSSGLLIAEGQGSGFVYDDQGHIVTNAHVIHGAEQMEVTFPDSTTRNATLVGEDLNSDLAVVKIENLPAEIQPLTLGNIDSLAVGQTVVAIGNPFGLEGTLTRGVISALGRSIPALTPFSIPQSIQTDAAINPGNSGGPLLNMAGEVIGVNAQIETGGTGRSNLGVGFAIPVSIMRMVIPDLIQNGEHEWAWLGVRGGNLNPSLVQAMGLPVEKGAYLVEVIAGGPSAQAGLQGANDTTTLDGRQVDIGGDIITAVNGQAINSFDDLLIYIALEAGPGKEITLTIWRDGTSQDVNVTLEKRPATLDTTTSPD